MPVAYRRKRSVPTHCAVCGDEIPDRGVNPGPPREVCLRKRCETRRDAAKRAARSTQEA